MKKLLIALIVGLTLTGCASRTGTAVLVGGTVGYILGKEQQRPAPVVIVQEQSKNVVIVREAGPCDRYTVYNERQACFRGIKQRIAEEERRRENEAFRRGYGK